MSAERAPHHPRPDAVAAYLDRLTGPEPDPADLQAFVDDLRPTGEPVQPDEVPPLAENDEVIVVRSMRMPPTTWARLRAAADARGVPWSTLVRQWIEVELAALEDDRPISRADALRALAGVPPLGVPPLGGAA